MRTSRCNCTRARSRSAPWSHICVHRWIETDRGLPQSNCRTEIWHRTCCKSPSPVMSGFWFIVIPQRRAVKLKVEKEYQCNLSSNRLMWKMLNWTVKVSFNFFNLFNGWWKPQRMLSNQVWGICSDSNSPTSQLFTTLCFCCLLNTPPEGFSKIGWITNFHSWL